MYLQDLQIYQEVNVCDIKYETSDIAKQIEKLRCGWS